jgi:hypothetical protein
LALFSKYPITLPLLLAETTPFEALIVTPPALGREELNATALAVPARFMLPL